MIIKFSQTIANLCFDIQKFSLGAFYINLVILILFINKTKWGYSFTQTILSSLSSSIIMGWNENNIIPILTCIPLIIIGFWTALSVQIWVPIQVYENSSMTYIPYISWDGSGIYNSPFETFYFNDFQELADQTCKLSFNCSFSNNGGNGIMFNNLTINLKRDNLTNFGMGNLAAELDYQFLNIAGTYLISETPIHNYSGTTTYGYVTGATSSIYYDMISDENLVGFNVLNRYSSRPLGMKNYDAAIPLMNHFLANF